MTWDYESNQKNMGIFLGPRITTADRLALTPGAAELIYDTDLGKYYYGDGATLGGLPVSSGGAENFSYEEIPVATAVTIPLYQQMIVSGGITIGGTLNINGTLVLI